MHIKNLIRALFVVVMTILSSAAAQAAPPVATNFSATVSTVGATLIQMQGSDPDGTALTFAVVSGPSHGTLSGLDASTGYVVFTPTSGYTGSDSFTFTVTSGGQTSAAATASITVTNAKTRIVDTLIDPAGNPRAGKVTFILTQRVTSPAGIIPVGATASAVLSGSGVFDISVYPSTALSPQAYYQVWYEATGSVRRELIGVYAIPASASTITLAAHRVTNTNLAAQYTFVDAAAINSILSVASGAEDMYTGTPADNALQRYDAASGKLENSPVTATDSTVTINTTNGVAINAAGLQPAAALQVDSTTRGFLPPRLTTVQRTAMPEVQQGLFIFNTTSNRPNVFTTGWEEAAYLSDFNSLNASNLSFGTVPLARITGLTNAQIDAAAAIDWSKVNKSGSSLADIATRSASDLSSGTVAPARLGSGGAGLGTKFLTDNSTFVLPESLGLVDISTPSDGAYMIQANVHTLTPGYIKQGSGVVAITGAGSAPESRMYADGDLAATNYIYGLLYADPNVIELSARGGGTYSGQNTAIRLKSLGTGEIQLENGNGIVWKQIGLNLVPQFTTQGIGLSNFPLGYLRMGSGGGVEFYNSNVKQSIMRSDSLNHVTFRKGDNSGGAILDADAVFVSAEAYGAGWSGNLSVPTKDDIYDKIESMGGGSLNPTSGQIPYNNSGTFDDSGLYKIGIGIRLGLGSGTGTDAPTLVAGSAAFGAEWLSIRRGDDTGFAGVDARYINTKDGYLQYDGTRYVLSTQNGASLGLASDIPIAFSSTTSASGSKDAGAARALAGVTAFTNGTTTVGTGTVQIGDAGTKPACNSTNRGMIWHDFGGAGVKDSVEICAKDASDAYAWRTVY